MLPKVIFLIEDANQILITANIIQLEKASERYYIEKGDWPKISDKSYNAEQLELPTQQVKDRAGKPVILDKDGQYYNFDYDKLQSYLEEPNKNSVNYIIQNPVGDVYYIDTKNIK